MEDLKFEDRPRRNPDAVMAPASLVRKRNPMLAGKELHDAACQILGVRQAYVRDQGEERFITASPHDTILFPIGHALEKQPRYDWYDRGDGLKYGYLIDPQQDAPDGSEAN